MNALFIVCTTQRESVLEFTGVNQAGFTSVPSTDRRAEPSARRYPELGLGAAALTSLFAITRASDKTQTLTKPLFTVLNKFHFLLFLPLLV